jgi:hypothetical protein
MSITNRRIVVISALIFAMLAMLGITFVNKTTMPRADAGYVCHVKVKPPLAPSLVWPMLSAYPKTRVTPMGSDWIDPLHRPSGGYQVAGSFEVNVTLEYHWCLQGRHPITTGLISPYRAQMCATFHGFRPTGVRSVHWHMNAVSFPTVTAGARQFAATPDTAMKMYTGKSWKDHWQCQTRAVSSNWVPLIKHPQWAAVGYVDKAKAKDWKWEMKYGGSKWRPFTPGSDQHRILF